MDDEGYMYGIADIFEAEYGSFHIEELRQNKIERDMYYTGPKTFDEVIIERKYGG